jgi:hypothetical protein
MLQGRMNTERAPVRRKPSPIYSLRVILLYNVILRTNGPIWRLRGRRDHAGLAH